MQATETNIKQNRNNKDKNVFATKLTQELLCVKKLPDLNIVSIYPYAICGKLHFRDAFFKVFNLLKAIFFKIDETIFFNCMKQSFSLLILYYITKCL